MNNSYLVKKEDTLAKVYSEESPLEYHHSSLTIQILQ